MHNETTQTGATRPAEPTIREKFAAADRASNAAVKARFDRPALTDAAPAMAPPLPAYA